MEEVRGKRLGLYCSVRYNLTDICVHRIMAEDAFGVSQFAKRNIEMQLVRFANVDTIEFGDGKSEKSNMVLNVNLDTRKNRNRLLVTCDVNTVSDNRQVRFMPKDLSDYTAVAREKIREMLSDFQAYIEQ